MVEAHLALRMRSQLSVVTAVGEGSIAVVVVLAEDSIAYTVAEVVACLHSHHNHGKVAVAAAVAVHAAASNPLDAATAVVGSRDSLLTRKGQADIVEEHYVLPVVENWGQTAGKTTVVEPDVAV